MIDSSFLFLVKCFKISLTSSSADIRIYFIKVGDRGGLWYNFMTVLTDLGMAILAPLNRTVPHHTGTPRRVEFKCWKTFFVIPAAFSQELAMNI